MSNESNLIPDAWSASRVKSSIRIAWVLSIIVWLLVGAMRRLPKIGIPEGLDLSGLPLLHAVLNSAAAICLILALVFVKQGNIKLHRTMISGAMLLSIVFLLSYVVYHLTHHEVRFGGEGTIRTVYLTILFSHIVLAGVSLPFILISYILGRGGQLTKHRKMVKWVFPVWLYVAITGPVCYLMLRPYY